MTLHAQNRSASGAKKFAVDPYWIAYLIFTVLITGLYISQLDDTMGWGDDWGAYLNGARNIIEGYPPNYRNLQIQGAPGYSLLLAATASIFSWSFADLKILQSVSIGALGLVVFGLARQYVGRNLAFLAAAISAAAPILLKFQHELYSDLPAAVFIYAALWSISCALDRNGQIRTSLMLSGITALLVLFALMIRPSASVVVFAIIIASMKHGFSARSSITRCGTLLLGGLMSLTAFLFYKSYWPSVADANISKIFTVYETFLERGATLPDLLWNQLLREVNHLAIIAYYHFPPLSLFAAFLIVLALAATIMWVVQQRILVLPLFLWIGAGVLWLTPWDADPRYQLMIYPALVILCASALEKISQFIGRPWVAPVALSMWLSSNIAVAAGLWNQPGFTDDPIHQADVQNFTKWLTENTGPEDVVCGIYKMRIFMYLASRPTCAISPQTLVDDPRNARDFLKSRKHAAQTKILVITKYPRVFDEFGFDKDVVPRVIEKLNADQSVRLVYDGDIFLAYKVEAD